MTKSRRATRLKKRKQRRKRIFYFVIFPILALIIATTAYGAYLVNKAANAVDDSYEEIDRDKIAVNPKKDNISILMLGVDDSEVRGFQEGSRTDAMMLATFNAEEKSVKMLSIPRDSYVYIPEKGFYSKINHAHSWGGVKSALETVENLLDIDVHYYVKMNFNAFVEVVDALGGVEVDVPYAISELDSKDNYNSIQLQPGRQLLHGEETLALARTRKMDNDFERGIRQQEILKAIINKATSASSISKYGNVIDAVGDNMSLNMRFSEITSFFNYVTAGSNLKIDTLNLEGDDYYENGTYYFKINDQSLAEVQQILKNHLLNKTSSNTETASPDEQN